MNVQQFIYTVIIVVVIVITRNFIETRVEELHAIQLKDNYETRLEVKELASRIGQLQSQVNQLEGSRTK